MAVSHHGELYSVFLIAFNLCLMSCSVLLCSVIKQVEHKCWCNIAIYSVSVSSLNVDTLKSSFGLDILTCCWVFGVWHFETACWYYFLWVSVSFSQIHCFTILCKYLVVIIQSSFCSYICIVISSLVLFVSSPPSPKTVHFVVPSVTHSNL